LLAFPCSGHKNIMSPGRLDSLKTAAALRTAPLLAL
jgi:hypothetical protein